MWDLVLALSGAKLLFLHCYRSTDFEVHRNWLAVTHSLPLHRWYTDETSPWTLDYPPLFAWFEWALSQVAAAVDPGMLDVANLDYASPATVLFQRLSVIVADLALAKGVVTCADAVDHAGNSKTRPSWSTRERLAVLVIANAGLLMVDHVHFQYNGFLFGVSLHSVGCLLRGDHLRSAFWFAVLLNLKHIYLYCAPAYFFYLLKHFVLEKDVQLAESAKRLFSLGTTVLLVFTVSLGPFAFLGQLPQLARRLFPFKRGLCHAYWAPNFWSVYNVADKILAVAGKKLELIPSSEVRNMMKHLVGFEVVFFFKTSRLQNTTASMTGGLVQEFDHEVLPSVSPTATFILAATAAAPALCILWRGPKSGTQFLRALVLCSFGSFMFGWSV